MKRKIVKLKIPPNTVPKNMEEALKEKRGTCYALDQIEGANKSLKELKRLWKKRHRKCLEFVEKIAKEASHARHK